MAETMNGRSVLAEALMPAAGSAVWIRRAVLVLAGVVALIAAAKVQVPMWPSPVPITLSTFAVLTIGAAYGPRLGLVTMLGYLAIGAAGYDVFAGSSATYNGMAYMLGGSGGYILGWLLAVMALGAFARMGWDRSVGRMALAMLAGSVLVYLPGVVWLYHIVQSGAFLPGQFASPWAQTMAWGVTPYLVGDVLKLVLAAMLLPALWKLVGAARR